MFGQFANPDYYEAQYNVRAAIPNHPEIFARFAQRSTQARERLACKLDVSFGPTDDETLDIFPAQGESKALLLFIHGGYWRALDKSDFSFIAEPFVERGVTVALNNYALAPKVSVEEIVRQCRAATAWLYRNAERYGADPDQLYVSGHSAGGHLTAMMVATDWPRESRALPPNLIKGALAVSGVFNLEPITKVSFNADVRLTRDSAEKLSPTLMRPAAQVPLYLSVGGAESDEFKRQTRAIAERWPELNPVNIPMPGLNHLLIIEELANPASALFQGALKMMRLPAA